MEDERNVGRMLVKRTHHGQRFSGSTHINIAHHLFGRNSGIYASYTALMNVNVQLDALKPSQKKYDRYWRDARENDDGRYGQHPTGIRGGYGYTLKRIKGNIEVETY